MTLKDLHKRIMQLVDEHPLSAVIPVAIEGSAHNCTDMPLFPTDVTIRNLGGRPHVWISTKAEGE